MANQFERRDTIDAVNTSQKSRPDIVELSSEELVSRQRCPALDSWVETTRARLIAADRR